MKSSDCQAWRLRVSYGNEMAWEGRVRVIQPSRMLRFVPTLAKLRRQREGLLIHSIVTYGDDALRRKAEPVVAVNDDIRQLIRDLLDTMYAARGVGLAAEQIGRAERVCVIDVPPDAEKAECREANAAIPMPLALINPEILSAESRQRDDEGCLSFPDISVPITRADRVAVAYTDPTGTRRTITACGLLARALQHEMDHLDGVLLVDRMSPMQRLSVSGQLKRLQKRLA